jgi:hypothetical protein
VNPKLQLNRGVKPKNHCFDIKAEEFLKNPQVIVDDFKELREKCDAANTGYQRFGNSITAVNHYQKHLNFPKNDQKVEVSQTTSFKMAIKIYQGPMDDPQSTQDRKSLMIFYKRKMTEAFGVCDMVKLQLKGRRIFKQINWHEIDRLDTVFYESAVFAAKKHLKVSLKMAHELSCKSVSQ